MSHAGDRAAGTARYAFGTFVFSAATLELTRDGRRVALEPQPARLLAALLARPGEVVAREDLRQAVWAGDTHVDYDRGLAYCVGQVRTALGDAADAPRFIQTLPRRGFRFIAPVTLDTGVVGPPLPPPDVPAAADRTPARLRVGQWAWLTTAALVVGALVGWAAYPPVAPVVAVSIFDNETGDPAHDTFVAGLSDLVVTDLTALAPGRLGVVGNLAPLRQPRNIRNLDELGRTLAADYIVLGQLQRQDAGLRFIVHLIRLRDGVHLSARRLLRPAAEVQAFEADVVAEAARAVRVHVLAEGP